MRPLVEIALARRLLAIWEDSEACVLYVLDTYCQSILAGFQRCLWTRLRPLPLNVIFLWSDDHIFCLQNITPRYVFNSVYQTNPENKLFFFFFKKWIHCTYICNTERCVTLSWKKPTPRGVNLTKNISNVIFNRMVVLNLEMNKEFSTVLLGEWRSRHCTQYIG